MAQNQQSSPANFENCDEMDLELRPSDPERTRTRFQVNRVRTASMNAPEQPLTLMDNSNRNKESQNQNKHSVLQKKESPKLNKGLVELNKGKSSTKQNKELHGPEKNYLESENLNKDSTGLNKPIEVTTANKESQVDKSSKEQNKKSVAISIPEEQNKGLKSSNFAKLNKQIAGLKRDEKPIEQLTLGSKETNENFKFSGSDDRLNVPSNELRHSVISLEPPPRKSINRLSRELSSSSSSGRLASDSLIRNSQELLESGNKVRIVPRVSIELRPIDSKKRLSDRYSVELRDGKRKSTKINIEGNTDDDDDVHSATDTTRLHVDTTNKSLRRMTREALPRLDNYRNVMSIQAANRPTLDELYNASTFPKNPSDQINQSNGGTSLANSEGSLKFGWIQGVLIRCLLNIWGVMLFLRLSWVVGQAGIGLAVILILTTTLVTSITALSMSAISTNGVIKGGGTYYMISRSLGPEFGGSIGLIFSLANAVACAMYVVGFCESLQDLVPHWPFGDRVNNIRVIGCVTLVLLTVIVVVGMKWEAKTQIVLLVILLIAILDFLIGCFMGPKNDEAKAKGFLGFNSEVVWNNTMPDFRRHEGIDYDFFKVFAVFFPAATGILAGANISGDLKDPQTAIPKGTLLAILLTTLSYILIAVLLGCTVNRDATGLIQDHLNFHQEFKFGLHHSFQVIELVSAEGSIIYAGCFAATLSSALASLVSAPKIFQALCKDKLYPRIEWFGKGFGSNNEPIRGYVLTFIIAVGFIVIGDLNAIAPLISNFFLAAYTLINFSTFHASLAKPVGWRPTFKYYNMWLSLLGAILCVIVMFLISWWTALLTFAVILALYLIVSYRKPNVNWGSTTQAQIYKNALQSAHQLNTVEDHVKNYRPQILVLTGMPSARPTLVQFAHMITKNLSVLICGHVNTDPLHQRIRTILTYKATGWLRAHKLKAFYQQIDGLGLRVGAKGLIASSGIGKLKPNILMMGFKSDWQSCPQEELVNYFEIIHDAFDMHLGVGILRIQEGLDVDRNPNEQDFEFAEINRNRTYSISQGSSSSEQSITNYNERVNISPSPNVDDDLKSIRPSKKSITESAPDLASEGDSASKIPPSFLKWGKGGARGTIDVWWLYDDGGLTLLLPYIISTRKSWAKCKLRVFALANKKDQLEMEHRNMASLLAKFRIAFSDLQIVADITTKPSDESQRFFDNLIANFKPNEEDSNKAESTDSCLQISEAELLANKDKSTRHIRLRELLLQHSSEATMVVITLPIPRKSIVSAPLYMAWLELLTKGMPPTLLVRGNQTSVLTFYS